MSQPSSQLPRPVRAALGLVATALDGARSFPEKAVEMPVLAVSAALQFSLRAQQRYAELTTRGDDLVGRLRGLPDEAPAWATFDETPADAPAAAPAEAPDGSANAASTSAPARDAESAPAAKAAPAKRTRAPSKTVTPAKTSAPAKKAQQAKKAQPAKAAKLARSERGAKTVRRPRTGRPSAFDAVKDERGEATEATERGEAADPAQHGETPGSGEPTTG